MSLDAATNAVVALQAGTFFLLAALLAIGGHWNLGAAQFLLGIVTILVYTVSA